MFDHLALPFEYEKEGFVLPSGPYLPDFWLPDLTTWVEVKGKQPTALEMRLAAELAEVSGCVVIIVWGNIPDGTWVGNDSGLAFWPGGGSDNLHCLCECLICHAIDFQFDGRSDRLACKYGENPCERSERGDKGYTGDSPRILAAYTAGRSARFEHGETPSRPYQNIVDYERIPF